MRLIKQGDDSGCGLACVAMMAGTTYASVRRTYRHVTKTERTDEVEPTQLSKLKAIMRQHAVVIDGRARRGYGRKPEDLGLAHDALLKVNPRLGGKEWHWVIWDHRRRRVLDPKEQPYKRLKVLSYWKLQRTSGATNMGTRE